MSPLYFEDLKLGGQYTTPEQAVTAEEIIAFARQFDPQPFHTDPVAAKTSLFGRLVASGWHTTAITMGLMVRGNMGLDGGVIGNGVDELRWPRPVLPGDRLRVVMTIAELNPEPSRTGRGKVKLRCQTFNQDGNVVQEMTARILVIRRPA
jgi:acyl dehydratase